MQHIIDFDEKLTLPKYAQQYRDWDAETHSLTPVNDDLFLFNTGPFVTIDHDVKNMAVLIHKENPQFNNVKDFELVGEQPEDTKIREDLLQVARRYSLVKLLDQQIKDFYFYRDCEVGHIYLSFEKPSITVQDKTISITSETPFVTFKSDKIGSDGSRFFSRLDLDPGVTLTFKMTETDAEYIVDVASGRLSDPKIVSHHTDVPDEVRSQLFEDEYYQVFLQNVANLHQVGTLLVGDYNKSLVMDIESYRR